MLNPKSHLINTNVSKPTSNIYKKKKKKKKKEEEEEANKEKKTDFFVGFWRRMRKSKVLNLETTFAILRIV